MLPIDYHIHTALCGHAQGEMEAYVEQAIELGIKVMAFSDHLPFLHLPADHPWHGRYSMHPHQLPGYCQRVADLQRKYPQIEIKLGIEVDYIPGLEEEIRVVLEEYPFDFVLGSIHLVDNWPFDDPGEIDKYQDIDVDHLWERYFDSFIQAVNSKLFDSMAHPDLIKKFAFYPAKPIQPLYRRAVEALAKANICIEINSSGLHKPVGEIYPSEEFLTLCYEAGIPVTIGSDAHRPQEVGRDFPQVRKLLQRVGYQQVALFRGRQRHMLPL
ncbi:MAG: histidinol-phosphatase HisJ family protein [Limnochordia bacterium]|jgi:histidinol-phosphatase (PHP family)